MNAQANPAIGHDSAEYIECNDLVVEVLRTARKRTADIRVNEGAVSIVVPTKTPSAKITQLITEKRQWIRSKLLLQREVMPASEKSFVSGEGFSYLGRNYRLKVNRGRFQPLKLIHGQLTLTCPRGQKDTDLIRSSLIQWYKHQAELKLQQKVKRYAEMMGLSPNGVGIKSFKSRWGSCSAKGKLDFNWKIVMAPNRIVDYVVVHELCHLKQHDHSPKFWKLVERVLPDYKERKEWLKENGRSLEV